MQMELVAREQEQMEVFPSGKYVLQRRSCSLPDGLSRVIGRHLAAVEAQQSPSNQWWRYYSHEIQALRGERQELLASCSHLSRWQGVTIGLGLIFEAAHGAIALIVTAGTASSDIAILAPTGGSALVFGAACTGMLRYLAKEKATARGRVAQVTKSLAEWQSMATSMISSDK